MLIWQCELLENIILLVGLRLHGISNGTPIKRSIVKWITDLNVGTLSDSRFDSIDWNICQKDEQWPLKRFQSNKSIFNSKSNSIRESTQSMRYCEITFNRSSPTFMEFYIKSQRYGIFCVSIVYMLLSPFISFI